MEIENITAARALTRALYRILVPLARVALRGGVPYDAVAEVAKRAFIDVAYREFTIPGRPQSASRVSVLTGIHRKEVGRLLRAAGPKSNAQRMRSADAVLMGWRRDEHFLDRRGKPAPLPFDKGSPSFSELVRWYGRGDLPARAVLDELVRVSAVARLKDRRIRLQAAAYLPGIPEALDIFGSDVSDLISAIDHNISGKPGIRFFQRKVAYDNLPAEAIEDIRARVARKGQTLLEKFDLGITKGGGDSNHKMSGTERKRAMVGVYYNENDVPPELAD